MLEALGLITNMGMPAAVAFVGVAFAIGIPLAIRRTLRSRERIEELQLKRAIQLEAFKRGAISHIEEQ